MTRLLLNLVTALSLFVCLAACSLWVRSQRLYDRLIYQTGHDRRGSQRCFVLGSDRGVFDFQHHHIAGLGRAYAEQTGLHTDHFEPDGQSPPVPPDHAFMLPGFGFLPPVTTVLPPAVWWRYSVYVPHYAVVLAAAALPAARLRARLRRQRSIRRRLCTCCGYDVRATPARCPECGSAVAPGFVEQGSDALTTLPFVPPTADPRSRSLPAAGSGAAPSDAANLST